MNKINQLTNDLGIFIRVLKCPFRLGQFATDEYIICNVKLTPEDFIVSEWEYHAYNTTVNKVPSKKAVYKCSVSLKSEVYEKLNNKKFLEHIRICKDNILQTSEASIALRNEKQDKEYSWRTTLIPLSDKERKNRLNQVKAQATTFWKKEKDEKIKEYIDNFITGFNNDIYEHNKQFFQEVIDNCLDSKNKLERLALLKPFLEDFKTRWAYLDFSKITFKDITEMHEKQGAIGWGSSSFEQLSERFAESIIFQKLIDIIEKETYAKLHRESSDTTGAF